MKYSKIFFASVLFLMLFSCKKLIEIKETDFIGGDVALKTVANTEQGIIGAYAAMNVEMGILLNAVLSDEVRKAEFYNAATAHEWQYSSRDIVLRDNFTAFPLYYRIIDRVNRVLQALPAAEATRPNDEALRSRLKGEALFLRAFCHFELYRFYSSSTDANGLALKYMDAPSLDPFARETVGPFFTKLKADMTEAKDLVPNNLTDIYRATKMAVTGLQARVALYLKEWNDAITYSTEYINTIPLSPMGSFAGIWTDANANESAFKLRRTTAAGGRMGSLFRATSANATNIGTVTWMPSEKLWSSYDQANDVRFSSYFKDEPLLSGVGRPSRLITKYAGTPYGTAAENIADAKVFRTGEMYLIRAEARAETNDVAGGAADLNALRAARISGYVNQAFGTKEALITAVIQERFKELAFEGHRLWDLRRRNLPVDRLPVDAPSTTAVTLPAGNFRFVLPIPGTEIDANPNIQQNDGYTQ
jgi:hypothetical protein